jgi:SAM-dependent methyltransferase
MKRATESSQHYVGQAGETYFSWQRKASNVGGILNARKFSPYIAAHMTADSAVLDFGCGGGDLLKQLPCSRKIGVEINAAARLVACRNGVEVYESLEHVADLCADIIISNHAIEHLLFPLDTLRELRNKLRPFGLLVIVLPLDDWRSQRTYDPDDINHHLYAWTPQSLGNLLTEAGFTADAFKVSILTDAWPPLLELLYKSLPVPVFRWCCWLTAVLRKRRQLVAIITA